MSIIFLREWDWNNQGGCMRLTAVYQKVEEGYIAFVEELPGANTQGATIEEARKNLKEAVSMVLEANRSLTEEQLPVGNLIKEDFILYEAPLFD
jgi:predicted RNase H-like HicB family nuclease